MNPCAVNKVPITQTTTPRIDRDDVPEGIKQFVAKKENDETQWWFSGDIKCPRTEWSDIFLDLNYHCAYCCKSLGSTVNELITTKLDNIIPPTAFCGDNSPNHEGNLVPCCSLCYALKDGVILQTSNDGRWESRKKYIGLFRELNPWVRAQVDLDMEQHVTNALIYSWDHYPLHEDFLE